MGDDNREQKFLRDTAVIGIGNILSKGIVFLLDPYPYRNADSCGIWSQ